VSPVFVFVLLTRVSGVPMLEHKGEKRWGNDPDYQRYCRETPVLVPILGRTA
jgi:steroid 5-alpha reductase family enzyme